MKLGRRLRRTRAGQYQLRLTRAERDLLRSLPGQVRELIETTDPADSSVRRLFPPAYRDEEEEKAEADYQSLVHDELLEHHRQALVVMEETIDADRLDEDQVVSWLSALNELRLVLGTNLDVTEGLEPVSPGDPRAPGLALYGYLSWLQEQVVEALEATL
ncbi:MAG TPA: DUF2017 family protein [Acidimicrobiales bacterium]|nr:DUF2017 family protein [Acidimicrobiales bacterium]